VKGLPREVEPVSPTLPFSYRFDGEREATEADEERE